MLQTLSSTTIMVAIVGMTNLSQCWQPLPARQRGHFQGPSAGPQSCGPAVKSLGRRSALRARRLVEHGAQSLGKLHGVVIGPEVQEEEEPRLLGEHVAVDRRHLDTVRAQRLD